MLILLLTTKLSFMDVVFNLYMDSTVESLASLSTAHDKQEINLDANFSVYLHSELYTVELELH